MVLIKKAVYTRRCLFSKQLIKPSNIVCLFNIAQYKAFEKEIKIILINRIPQELIEIIIRFTNYKNLIGQFGHQDITNWIGKIPQIRYHTHLDFVDEDEDSSSESELSD